MKKITCLICLFVIALQWMGCRNAARPTPEMTRMGLGSGLGGDDNGGSGRGGQSDNDRSRSGDLGDFGAGVLGDGGLDGDLGLQNRDASFNAQAGEAYESVFFDYDRSYVRESERSKLNDTAKHLLQNLDFKVLIEGHCDWKGTTEYNLALGDRRANSVKSYLVTLGVAPSKIEVLSKGDLEAVEGADDAGRQLDRRADIFLIP